MPTVKEIFLKTDPTNKDGRESDIGNKQNNYLNIHSGGDRVDVKSDMASLSKFVRLNIYREIFWAPTREK